MNLNFSAFKGLILFCDYKSFCNSRTWHFCEYKYFRKNEYFRKYEAANGMQAYLFLLRGAQILCNNNNKKKMTD